MRKEKKGKEGILLADLTDWLTLSKNEWEKSL